MKAGLDFFQKHRLRTYLACLALLNQRLWKCDRGPLAPSNLSLVLSNTPGDAYRRETMYPGSAFVLGDRGVVAGSDVPHCLCMWVRPQNCQSSAVLLSHHPSSIVGRMIVTGSNLCTP